MQKALQACNTWSPKPKVRTKAIIAFCSTQAVIASNNCVGFLTLVVSSGNGCANYQLERIQEHYKRIQQSIFMRVFPETLAQGNPEYGQRHPNELKTCGNQLFQAFTTIIFFIKINYYYSLSHLCQTFCHSNSEIQKIGIQNEIAAVINLTT